MLQRASSRREQRARWQREYRRRQRAGSRIAEVSAATIEMLIVTRWLREHEAGDRHAIAKALDALSRELLTSGLKRFR
jgi:hypothetical protein